MALYPCSVCFNDDKFDAIECDLCNFWVHRCCIKLSKYELKRRVLTTSITIVLNVLMFFHSII